MLWGREVLATPIAWGQERISRYAPITLHC